MSYIGKTPASAALKSSDITDGIITTAKIVDANITTAKITNDAVTVDKLNLISTGSVPSLEAKGTSGVTEGYIQLNCAENSHGIKLKSPPHSASASYTLTFPNNDGDANQFLQSNGSGVMTWASAGGVNTPAFEARLSSNLTLASTATVDVVFQTERFDVGGCYNTSNGVFTVPSNEGGKYVISTRCTFLDGNGNMSRFILYMNSSIGGSGSQDVVDQADCTSDGTLFVERTLQSTSILALSAGDTIKFQVYQQTNNNSSASLRSGAQYTVFSAFKLIE